MPKQRTAAAMTLQEAADAYLRSLDTKEAQESGQAVRRFVQWCGPSRSSVALKPADVERFDEEYVRANGAQPRDVAAVRAFLAWLKKEGLTTANLAGAIKVRRGESAAANGDSETVLMTREGYEALQRELEELKARRPQIAEALRLAMADKDFRENAPLDAARDQQAHVEAQIRRIELMLKHARIVEGTASSTGGAHVGSRVVVVNVETAEEMQYQLVSPGEVNPREGKISIASPVGKALLDRVPGDEVQVSVPRGMLRLRVKSVEN